MLYNFGMVILLRCYLTGAAKITANIAVISSDTAALKIIFLISAILKKICLREKKFRRCILTNKEICGIIIKSEVCPKTDRKRLQYVKNRIKMRNFCGGVLRKVLIDEVIF